jgi:hypothetical protein
MLLDAKDSGRASSWYIALALALICAIPTIPAAPTIELGKIVIRKLTNSFLDTFMFFIISKLLLTFFLFLWVVATDTIMS